MYVLRAQQVLEAVTKKLKANDSFHRLKLEFSGIGHFNDSVVFVNIKDGPSKDKLYQIAGNFSDVVSSAALSNFRLSVFLFSE